MFERLEYKTKKADELFSLCTKEDYDNWKINPCTRYLKARLECDLQLILQQWANGTFTAESAEGTAQANAKALGELHALERYMENIQDLQYDIDKYEEDNIDNDTPDGTSHTS